MEQEKVTGKKEESAKPADGERKNDFDEAVKAAVGELLKDLYAQFGELKREVGELSKKQEVNEAAVSLNGAVTGETGRETPDMRVDFSKLSYSELCSFLEKHPRTKLSKI